MELLEAISRRRSVRKFDPSHEVSDEVVKKLLNAAIAAPSAGNGQSWRFVVVREVGLKKKLAIESGHQGFIGEAPVVIVVCADLALAEENYGLRGRNTYSLQETSAAIENILLVATSLGLGTCWVGAFDETEASKILDLPKDLRPVAILPIGLPAEKQDRAPPRKKIEDVTTFK